MMIKTRILLGQLRHVPPPRRLPVEDVAVWARWIEDRPEGAVASSGSSDNTAASIANSARSPLHHTSFTTFFLVRIRRSDRTPQPAPPSSNPYLQRIIISQTRRHSLFEIGARVVPGRSAES